MVLPGVQALLGFQLAVTLTRAFEALPYSSKLVHAAALMLVALAVILLIAPAAFHRIAFSGEDTEEFHRIGFRIRASGSPWRADTIRSLRATRTSGRWAARTRRHRQSQPPSRWRSSARSPARSSAARN